MTRTDIINILIKKFNYKSYLEIGVDNAINFNKINIADKIGIDPDPIVKEKYKEVITINSDDFFKSYPAKFDIIFIDGLHHAEQVYRDIINSILFLNKGGTIVCHDMLPPNEQSQIVPRQQMLWTGDCWKAWVKLRSERKDLDMCVVNTDFGCGIIKKGIQELISLKKIDYNSFKKNKKEWMNIISTKEFMEL